MSLLLTGISHHTAPIEERERFSVPENALPQALRQLLDEPGVSEALIVSTCNRIEVVVEAEGEVDLVGFLARRAAAGPESHRWFYVHRGPAAVRHLFRVASSLDSLVVGEPQILGQLKHAVAVARTAGTVGSSLEAVVTGAFRVAKRVRTETEIASQPVSVATAAVDLVRQIFGRLEGQCTLVIGAGAMGELTARVLQRQGAAPLLFANRTRVRAEALARKHGGETIAFEELAQQGARADIIVTCAGAAEPLIRRADVVHFLAQRRQRPMLFLDLSVPRDVDPSIHELGNAFVYNVDDLERVVNVNRAGRQREADRGEALIEAELANFRQRLQVREIAPIFRALQAHGESLLQAELDRLRRRAGDLTPAQEQEIAVHMRRFMQKLLHQPLVGLRDSASGPELDLMLDLVQRLFGLTDTAVRTAEAGRD